MHCFHPVQKSGQFAPKSKTVGVTGVHMFSSRSKVRSVRTNSFSVHISSYTLFSSRSKVRSVRTCETCKRLHNKRVFIPFKSPVSSHHNTTETRMPDLRLFSSRSKVRSVRTEGAARIRFGGISFHPVQKSGQFAP